MKTNKYINALTYFLYIIISILIMDNIYILCTMELQRIALSWIVSQLIIDILSIFLVRYYTKSISTMEYNYLFIFHIVSFTFTILFLLTLPYFLL